MRLMVRGLTLAVLVCFGLTTLAAPVAYTPAQQESVNKIAAKGGLVMQLAADSDALVVNLSLAGKQATDAELAEVKGLPKVAQLNLANTAVTDAGLANLASLSELTSLHLEKTAVTDAGLANLASLSELTSLHLEKTAVTDAGLANVKGLAKLEYLNLYSTGVTDAGLANLAGLKNLKRLYLWQSKVTDAGVATLKKAVPGVTVNRGEELAIVVKVPDPAPAAAPASASASGSASKALNSKCPVSGKDVVLPNTLTHEGKLVAFCCDKCPKAFAAEPAKYAANIKFDIAATPEKKPEAKPADKKPDAKPADVKPADVKPVEKKVEEKKPEAKPAEVKPVEKKPEEKKPAAAADPVPAAPAAVVVSTVNTKCPVSEHAIETGFTAVVDGRTVGFCCDKCLAKFNKDPKKFADKIVADAKK